MESEFRITLSLSLRSLVCVLVLGIESPAKRTFQLRESNVGVRERIESAGRCFVTAPAPVRRENKEVDMHEYGYRNRLGDFYDGVMGQASPAERWRCSKTQESEVVSPALFPLLRLAN